jgi:hypothetical protein
MSPTPLHNQSQNDDDSSPQNSMGLYIGITLAVLLILVAVGVFIWHKRRHPDATVLDGAPAPPSRSLDEDGYIVAVNMNPVYEHAPQYDTIDPDYPHSTSGGAPHALHDGVVDMSVDTSVTTGTSYAQIDPDHALCDGVGTAITASTQCSYRVRDGRSCKCRRMGSSMQCDTHTCKVDGCMEPKSSRMDFCPAHSGMDVYGETLT